MSSPEQKLWFDTPALRVELGNIALKSLLRLLAAGAVPKPYRLGGRGLFWLRSELVAHRAALARGERPRYDGPRGATHFLDALVRDARDGVPQ